MSDGIEVWDLWLPGPGATGLPFARSRISGADAGDRLLVHAAPPKLQVTVRDASGTVLATGDGLERHQPGPMSFLVRRGATITLEDGWPTEEDIGRVVLDPLLPLGYGFGCIAGVDFCPGVGHDGCAVGRIELHCFFRRGEPALGISSAGL